MEIDIKDLIDKIGSNKKPEDMDKLGDMFSEVLYDLNDYSTEEFDEYATRLYELANGRVIDREMADEWVNSMKPFGKKWTIEETTNAMKSMNYNHRDIDYYIAANMMYNDNYDMAKDDESQALKMGHNWLNDIDAVSDKTYCYWKYIVKK